MPWGLYSSMAQEGINGHKGGETPIWPTITQYLMVFQLLKISVFIHKFFENSNADDLHLRYIF